MAKSKSKRLKKAVSVPPIPWGGDHGTGTQAAKAGTKLVAVKDSNGKNPNNLGQRKRIIVLDDMLRRGTITMRQHQAGIAIQEAYCRVEMLSSGGPLKEQVQSSPKPDAAVAIQVGANSRLVHVMKPVLQSNRGLIEAVCWHNKPLRSAIRGGFVRGYTRFRETLDVVADHLCY